MNRLSSLYYQIAEDLKRKIVDGYYNVGDPLPSEKEIVKLYKVSRLTAREAVKILVQEGMVEKIQGKGSFVTKLRSDHRVGSLFSFGEELILQKFNIKTDVLEAKRVIADKDICEKLKIESGEEVFYLERLRYANEIPFAFIKCYLPYKYLKGIEKIDFTDRSLYRTLEEEFKLQLKEAIEEVEAFAADGQSAGLLNIPPGTPVLLNKRITSLIDDTIIEFERVLYRSDIFKYRNKLIGRWRARLL